LGLQLHGDQETKAKADEGHRPLPFLPFDHTAVPPFLSRFRERISREIDLKDCHKSQRDHTKDITHGPL